MRDHKSLIAWQRARATVSAVIRASRAHWKPSAAAVFSQLQRSSLSVQLNIAEGYALCSPGRFRYHLNVAYGSAVETVELLELSRDEEFLPQELSTRILATARETERLILGLIKAARKQRRGA